MRYPPFKWHGGKSPIAGELVQLMGDVDHMTYMEPYFGAGSVLLAKDPLETSEIANDVYSHLHDFFAVLRDPDRYGQLTRLCQLTPFSEAAWRNAQEVLRSDGIPQVERAHAFYISVQQSRQGLQKDFATATMKRLRGHRNAEVNAYLSSIERLPEIHQRLQNVMFFSREALRMIESQDRESRLIYADPPYIAGTRKSKDAYACEMTDKDHHNLVDVFLASKSKIMLSGYPGSENIYKRLEEAGWGVWRRGVVKHSSSQKVKPREFEQIWSNFELNTTRARKWEKINSSAATTFAGLPSPISDVPRSRPIAKVNRIHTEKRSDLEESVVLPALIENLSAVSANTSRPQWLELRPLLKKTALHQIHTPVDKGSSKLLRKEG